jgi:hypothetical protein
VRSDTAITNYQLLHRQYVTNETLYEQMCKEMPTILAEIEAAERAHELTHDGSFLRRNRDALQTYQERQQLAEIACDPTSSFFRYLASQPSYSGDIFLLIEEFVGEPQFSMASLATLLDLRKEVHIRRAHQSFLGCRCRVSSFGKMPSSRGLL